MPLDEYAFSMQMRDTIAKMVREEIENVRPKYRYATVTAIDRVAKKATVSYNGETGSVRVNMGAIQPTAVGQIVRVEGIGTDKFITDVIGIQGYGQPVGTISPYYTAGPVTVTWDGDTATSGPYRYIARGYRPWGGDRVTLISKGSGVMLVPLGNDLLSSTDQMFPQWYYVTDTVGFQNGWTNFSPRGTAVWFYGYTTVQDTNDPYEYLADYSWAGFSKSASGIVKLKGLIKNGTVTAGTVIFNLPVGFRPATQKMFGSHNANSGALQGGSIDVYPNGDVVVRAAHAAWTSLENITFLEASIENSLTWVRPTWNAGWSDFSGVAWPYVSVAIYNGFAWWRGLAKYNTGNPAGTVAMFTMSSTYRHTRYTNFRTTSGNQGGNVSLGGTNSLTMYSKSPNVGAYISFDGICWPLASAYPDNTGTNESQYMYPAGLNGWVAWETDTPNAFGPIRVIRTWDGFVWMEGTVKNAAAVTSSQICNLPPGYRTKGTRLFGGLTNDTAQRFDVDSDGGLYHSGAYTAGNYDSVDGLNWFAEK